MPARMGPSPHYIHVEGMEELRTALRSLTPTTQQAVISQAGWEMDIMFDLSQVYVPKDTTALQQSGRKHGPEITRTGIDASISYGGDNLNPKTGQPTRTYAVTVHEDLDMHHLYPTRAKYLEAAVLERMPNLQNRIARFVGPEVEAQLVLQRMGRRQPITRPRGI